SRRLRTPGARVGAALPGGDREPVQAEERELVPVPPLEHDLPVYDVEEPAAAEAERVPPLEDRPRPVLEQVLDEARHVGRRELALERGPDGLPALDGLLGHLVVHGAGRVEGGDPRFYDVPRTRAAGGHHVSWRDRERAGGAVNALDDADPGTRIRWHGSGGTDPVRPPRLGGVRDTAAPRHAGACR